MEVVMKPNLCEEGDEKVDDKDFLVNIIWHASTHNNSCKEIVLNCTMSC